MFIILFFVSLINKKPFSIKATSPHQNGSAFTPHRGEGEVLVGWFLIAETPCTCTSYVKYPDLSLVNTLDQDIIRPKADPDSMENNSSSVLT